MHGYNTWDRGLVGSSLACSMGRPFFFAGLVGSTFDIFCVNLALDPGFAALCTRVHELHLIANMVYHSYLCSPNHVLLLTSCTLIWELPDRYIPGGGFVIVIGVSILRRVRVEVTTGGRITPTLANNFFPCACFPNNMGIRRYT